MLDSPRAARFSSVLMRRILLTGGAGFIGSNFVHYLLTRSLADHVTVLDKLTYAAGESWDNLPESPRMSLIRGSINSDLMLKQVFRERFTHIVHMAAESHVDRSISGPAPFVETNVTGTLSLLEACRRAGFDGMFLHVSTDEVFGELGEYGFFTEDSPYRPSSPYSASKAASDHLVRSYVRTYGFPAVIVNCSNNYGPRQHVEKLIPRMITACLRGEPLTVHGDGQNVRDWLHVDDCCAALDAVLDRARAGDTYLVGGSNEWSNLNVVKAVCSVMDHLYPEGRPHARHIEHVTDRPGNDRRYGLDTSRIRDRLGWVPQTDFLSGLRRTARWYVEKALTVV